MQEKAISVSQLSTYIRDIFNAEEMLFNISVFGEITSYNISRGVAYFCLKDEGALLSCVAFDTGSLPLIKDGDKVIVKGTPNYYVKGGKLNFNVSKITLNGEGELYQQFILLKTKLEQEGLFKSEHKKNIPKSIMTIGVATSQTGAVFHDIINVATRRNPNINIVLSPCKVQGIGSEIEIANAIKLLDKQNVDVIIVARGGGSIEDLAPFNSEIVARTIYNCEKFVISAVGHETDFTIADFVADLRAPTPSAAAELSTNDLQENQKSFKLLISRLINCKYVFDGINSNLLMLTKSLKSCLNNSYQRIQTNTNALVGKFATFGTNLISEWSYRLEIACNSLEKLNPVNMFKMGYVKAYKNGIPLSESSDLNIGEQITIEYANGVALTEVLDKRR